jgi:hypothetical protein
MGDRATTNEIKNTLRGCKKLPNNEETRINQPNTVLVMGGGVTMRFDHDGADGVMISHSFGR